MDCSTLGFPVFHCLQEFAQTQVCWVGDAIQPSHPLSPPSSPAFNLSQHQGLFQWVSSLHAKLLYACVLSHFSHSVVSNSLWPHGLQHTRPPCPSPSPGACSNSCSLSWWCHPTISSSVIPIPCSQSFPASGSFPMSWLFTSGSQSITALASASVFQCIFRVDFL